MWHARPVESKRRPRGGRRAQGQFNGAMEECSGKFKSKHSLRTARTRVEMETSEKGLPAGPWRKSPGTFESERTYIERGVLIDLAVVDANVAVLDVDAGALWRALAL